MRASCVREVVMVRETREVMVVIAVVVEAGHIGTGVMLV